MRLTATKKLKVGIFGGKHSEGDFFFGLAAAGAFDLAGDFEDGHTLVFLRGQSNNVFDRDTSSWSPWSGSHAKNYGALDVAKLNQDAQSERRPTPDGLAKQLTHAREVVDIVEKSVAEFTELGEGTPVGAFSGAIFGLVNVILLAVAPENEPPLPPTITEITEAMKDVVIEALQEQKAKDVAAACVQAAQFCGHWASAARDRVPKTNGHESAPPEFDTSDIETFRSGLRGWLHGNGNFQQLLGRAKAESEVAKYILPTFVSGLFADLQMRRMDLMVHVSEGHTETQTDLRELRDLATSALTALDNAKHAFHEFCLGTVKTKYNLAMNATAEAPELQAVRETFTLKYTGATDLPVVDNAKKKLDDYIKALDEDIQSLGLSKPTKYVLPHKKRRKNVMTTERGCAAAWSLSPRC